MKIRKQRGLTLIGFVLVLVMTVFIAFIGMRIVPMYMDYYAVVSALNGVAAERGSSRLSAGQLRLKVIMRLQVSYVESVGERDIKISRQGGLKLGVDYEVRQHIIGNLDVVGKFSKYVPLAN